MEKISFKELLMLPLALLVTEILNSVILFILGFLILNDTIIITFLAVFSILMYYFIGKKIFAKIKNKKTKKYSTIITSGLINVH